MIKKAASCLLIIRLLDPLLSCVDSKPVYLSCVDLPKKRLFMESLVPYIFTMSERHCMLICIPLRLNASLDKKIPYDPPHKVVHFDGVLSLTTLSTIPLIQRQQVY